DMIPLLAAVTYAAIKVDRTRAFQELISDRQAVIAIGAGIVIYFLHITAAEISTGRSIGKILSGLKVVSLDGRRAAPGAIVIRNVLRIIDVGLLFMPLVVIFYSPLRQRAGDAAAGTLV